MSRTKEVLTIWHGRALFLGHSIDTTPHQHYALQVSVGLERPFRLLSDGEWKEHRAVLIASNHPHQLEGSSWQAVFLVDPTLESTQYIRAEQPVQPINFNSLAPIVAALSTDAHSESCDQLTAICDQLLEKVGGTTIKSDMTDPRIQEAVAFISQQPLKKVSAAAIAKAVFLSESRLAHLFKAQVGVPIRRYLLWLRLMDAIENIVAGEPFTTAAHEAGFADSAHLSRTFRGMFGLTLSDLFKGSQFIQVNTCRS